MNQTGFHRSIAQLQRILRHLVALTEFVIPYGTFTCFAPDIDFLFITELTNAKSLTRIDITDCPMSPLCFLKFLANIEILNVSDCRNLVDADFSVVKTCKNLSQLYVAFTKITPDTILSICSCLTLIVVDASGIPLQLGPGRVVQSVTCLATDACLTADPGVVSSILARSHTFVEIDHVIISTIILLPSADSFKKGCYQLQAKVCAQISG